MPDTERLLITTADERTWRNDRPVLFLGEWCRPYSLRATWERMDAAVVPPYGWREGQQDADYARVQQLYELLLGELGDELNRYHGTTFSRRYWRILIGPWLNTFVAIVFNRWATIQLALDRFRVSGSLVLDLPEEQVVPRDNVDFIYKWLSHEWNHAIFARILNGWTDVACQRLGRAETGGGGAQSEPARRLPRGGRVKEIVKRRLGRLSQMFSRDSDAFLISTYLPVTYQCLLQLALGQFPSLWHTETPDKVSADQTARKRLRCHSQASHGLEHCLRVLLSEQLPTIYLEGYPRLTEIVGSLPWPKRPRVIFTSSNMYSDEIFKAWAAERVEQGVPYVIGQHGGVYGTARFTRYEDHEAESADRVLTWGWSDGHPKHHPVAALRVVGSPSDSWKPEGHLLLVTTHGTRYSRDPWDTTHLESEYLEDQIRFATSIPPEIRSRMIVRLHPETAIYSLPHDAIWRDRCPEVQLELGIGKIEPLIRSCRCFVYTYNSTGFLETLARNIPTILFWNPAIERLRASAEPFYEALRAAGVLHYDPLSAARKIAEIWSDVGTWWKTPEVQSARIGFCRRYALLPEDPIAKIKAALLTARPWPTQYPGASLPA